MSEDGVVIALNNSPRAHEVGTCRRAAWHDGQGPDTRSASVTVLLDGIARHRVSEGRAQAATATKGRAVPAVRSGVAAAA